MDVPEFLFGTTILAILFKFGFHILDKPDISNPAWPGIMSIFKHSLVIAVCHSSTYSLKFSPQLKMSFYGIIIYTLLYNPNGSLLSYCHFYIFTLNNFINFFVALCDSDLVFRNQPDEPIARVMIHVAVGSSIVLAREMTGYFPCFVLCVALVCSGSWVLHNRWEKKGKLIKLSVGILGTIFFHSFVQFTSFSQVLAFMFFTVAWLANLGLLQASDEFGVLGFLLSNLIVGLTVVQLGFWLILWLAYGSSMLFFGQCLYLEAISHQERKWS